MHLLEYKNVNIPYPHLNMLCYEYLFRKLENLIISVNCKFMNVLK